MFGWSARWDRPSAASARRPGKALAPPSSSTLWCDMRMSFFVHDVIDVSSPNEAEVSQIKQLNVDKNFKNKNISSGPFEDSLVGNRINHIDQVLANVNSSIERIQTQFGRHTDAIEMINKRLDEQRTGKQGFNLLQLLKSLRTK